MRATPTDLPATLRYLDAAAVAASLPGPSELVELGALALRSLEGGAQVPPKAAVTDPAGTFAHAMPAHLAAAAVPGGGGAADLLGMKWIAGSSANRSRDLPAMSALIVLSDPPTGLPLAILEGGAITAWRTAALSGVAIRLLVRRP